MIILFVISFLVGIEACGLKELAGEFEENSPTAPCAVLIPTPTAIPTISLIQLEPQSDSQSEPSGTPLIIAGEPGPNVPTVSPPTPTPIPDPEPTTTATSTTTTTTATSTTTTTTATSTTTTTVVLYTITASATLVGSPCGPLTISPTGTFTAPAGSLTFTLTYAGLPCFTTFDVSIDGGPATPLIWLSTPSYTMTVSGNHTIVFTYGN